jgi:hypothetical protein
MVPVAMEQPTMESILRTLREMLEREPDDAPISQPPTLPEEIERAIRE